MKGAGMMEWLDKSDLSSDAHWGVRVGIPLPVLYLVRLVLALFLYDT